MHWQPTPQIAWIKQPNGSALLCQLWIEGFNGAQGFQTTGNARWQEVPSIEAPQTESVDSEDKSQLIL
jgi:hypothetical protein